MSYPLLAVRLSSALELLIVVLGAALWLAYPGFGRRQLSQASALLGNVSRHKRSSCILTALVALCGAASTSLITGIPRPAVHDEFSYLLAAKTFSAGRLAVPAHPLWEHFETFHVLQQPVHASKYPPGQGLVLAAGMLVGGHPIWGVWMMAAAACAAITWMLQGWIRARWALIGGLISALNFGFFSDWSQTYWGGLLAAFGGALFFGAIRRLIITPSSSLGAILGIGMIVLMNSRPFEGAVTVIFTGAALMFLRPRPKWWISSRVFPLLTAGAFLSCGILMAAYYNWRLAGDPLKMPYALYERQYRFVPLFLFIKPEPNVIFHNVVFDKFRQWGIEEHSTKRTLSGFIHTKVYEVCYMGFTFIRAPFLIPFLIAVLMSRQYWTRAAYCISFALFLVLLAETWTSSRKYAPATGLIIFLISMGLRRMRVLFRNPAGSRMTPPHGLAVYRASILAILVSSVAGFAGWAVEPEWSAERSAGGIYARSDIEKQLSAGLVPQLVFVRYSNSHNPHHEWVYNAPDIDAARVVWARDLGSGRNCSLIQYFGNRQVWLLEPDANPVLLRPYPVECSHKVPGVHTTAGR